MKESILPILKISFSSILFNYYENSQDSNVYKNITVETSTFSTRSSLLLPAVPPAHRARIFCLLNSELSHHHVRAASSLLSLLLCSLFLVPARAKGLQPPTVSPQAASLSPYCHQSMTTAAAKLLPQF